MIEMCERLTEREREVLRWVAEGKTAKQTSFELEISINTVNFHIKNVLRKLGVENKTAATMKAMTLGLLSDSPVDVQTDGKGLLRTYRIF